MTSCPPTLLLRFPLFHSEAEVAEELVRLVLVAHRALLDLPDLRVTLVNEDLPDQKAPVVFRVPLDPLAAELEEPLFLAPKVLEDLLVPLDLRENKESRVLPDLRAITDFLAQPEQTVNLDQRVTPGRQAPLDPPGLRVLLDPLDLQESAAPPGKML